MEQEAEEWSPDVESEAMEPVQRCDELDGPRGEIRAFLRRLFALADLDVETEQWPEISSQAFVRVFEVLRARVAALYALIDEAPGIKGDVRRSARLYVENMLNLAWWDWHRPAGWEVAAPEVRDLLAERPISTLAFDQLYCTPASTQRRVDLIQEQVDLSRAKILFLGDDDLGSVVLTHRCPGPDVHMLDLDDRLLSFVEERAPTVHRHKIDLIEGGMPASWFEAYDVVVLDPPWEYGNAWFFLNKALFCLKRDPSARVVLCFSPIYLEHRRPQILPFLRRLTRHGISFERIEPNFQIYTLAREAAPELREILDRYLPQLDSPLLELSQELPYACSNLYLLKRVPGFRPNPIRHALFRWWNQA